MEPVDIVVDIVVGAWVDIVVVEVGAWVELEEDEDQVALTTHM